ncbi:T9SS type A sorting domain-containing protein [bacterium]|nr:T9SS type A sorting domain-containing protein [bacterium]MBU1985421.1 T9SS type A sorting domain-containing protein [bacterium]
MPLPFAASGNNVGATNVYDFATAYCITNISYDNGYDLIYEMVIDRNMCITIGVVQGSYDYMSVSLWDACPDQGVVHCLAGTFASTGNLTIPCTPVVPGTYYIMLDNWPTPYQFDYTLTVDECTCPSSCEDWVLCGTPTETEPNGVCATEVDPYVIGCDALVYGKICPAADHDFYKIIVPPQTFMQLSFFDEVDCIASPPVCVRNNLYYEDCSVAGSANQYGWNMTNSGDVPWVLYIDFYALAGCQATYKIVTTCCPIVDYCLNPIYTPGEFFYQETVNTCCGTNVIPMIGTNCAATYASGKDVVFAIVIRDATCYIDSIHVEYPGADEQWWFGTDCTNPASCLFSQDAEGGAGAEVQYGMNVVAGTYYLVVSRYSTACGPLTVTIAADCRLPVEFLGADAIAGDGKVTVNWATASETNLDHFEISRDGEMVSIGANNTPERREYSWTETGLENGMTYTYSLVAVSLNGSRDELATVSATPSFEAGAVTEYALHQNYPNPFNPTTSISFDLKDAGLVNLKVYNLMGQEVAKVVNGEMSAGRHTVSFNSGNLSSGIYLYRIEVNGFAAEKKMLLMK